MLQTPQTSGMVVEYHRKYQRVPETIALRGLTKWWSLLTKTLDISVRLGGFNPLASRLQTNPEPSKTDKD